MTVRPFLMFEGDAEAAMSFYVSLFPDGEVLDVVRYGPDGPGPPGSIMKAGFSIGGQTILCTDSFVQHGFTFTPASSLFVDCESEEEVRRLRPRWRRAGRCSCRWASTASAAASRGSTTVTACPGN